MINNLIKHERIKTTYWRAFSLQPTVDKMIKEGIDGIKNEDYQKVQYVSSMILHDDMKQKFFNEIIPRFI